MAKLIQSYSITESGRQNSGTPPTVNFSRWDITVSDTDNQAVSVTGDSFVINYPTVMVTRATNVGVKKNAAVNFYSTLKNNAGTALWNLHQRSPRDYNSYTWTSIFTQGTANQIYRRSDVTDSSKTYQTATYFNSNNSTSRTINFSWTVQLQAGTNSNTTSAGLHSRAYEKGSGTISDPGYGVLMWTTGTKTTTWNVPITLNAPPTFTSTNVSFNESYHVAGHTTASVTISSLSAKYGGTIKSAVLKIGNQTATRTSNGVLSIACNTAGTFTPTVTVTDSRGQVTTKSLAAITINSHTAPTLTSSQVSFDAPAYANYCNASVTVSDATAYQGASVSSIKLTIGSQSVTRANNGTLTIACNTAGTFTPTVTITDNWGGTKTYSLNAVTVNQYVSPTVDVGVERTNSAGVVNDEGTSAVVSAKLTYTYQTASLQIPVVEATDQNGATVTGLTITWYSDRALTTVISDWSSITSGSTVYALITDNDGDENTPFDTQYSYQIKVTPRDTRTSGNPITATLGGAYYTVDFLAGGHGIAFGAPSVQEGFFCNMDMFLGLPEYQTSDTDDEALYDAITALEWQNDVIE